MPLLALLALIGGAAIGLFLPDVDRSFPFLLHRSILTHSALIPLLCAVSLSRTPSAWKRCAVIGLCTAMAVHLSFDLFPVLWMGFALIQVPLYGSLGATLSMVWILGSSIACLYLALWLLTSRIELVLAVGVGLSAFLIAARTERVFWPALFALLLAGLLAMCLPNRLINGQIVLGSLWRKIRAGVPTP
jgi:hypothetical protein